MKNLFNFIIKNIHWLLFLLLVSGSVFLIVKNNQFQRSKFLAVAQEVTGTVYSVTNGYQAYMNLNSTNTDLLNKIAELETDVYRYRKTIEQLTDSGRTAGFEIDSLNKALIYRFTLARVINNNVSGLENYITLDKGSEDGVEPDMGALSANGVVGVVIHTSLHCSVVIPILNPKFKLSCKVKNNNYSGPLVWNGKDARYANLTELPRHVDFEIGDTVVTSGYSTIFPEGLPVGTIEDSQKQKDDNYTSLKIKLFTNFNTLSEVIIVRNSYQKEQKELEETILNPQPVSQKHT
ncbi:MAG: rod shape-determining protein MreC [Candidatus Symbiothrix sp.]|nr:rod shape-determining protein MreC [Candidatus Symbiothrix sp.]